MNDGGRPQHTSGPAHPTASTGHAASLVELGTLLLEAGISVTDVREELEAVRRGAVPEEPLTFAVLPDTVLISRERGAGPTAMGSTGEGELSIRQAAHAVRLARDVAQGSTPIDAAGARARAIRTEVSTHPMLGWVLGNALISAGLTVVFRCPWWAVLLATVVGCLVGLVARVMVRIRPAAAIVPFAAAFLSTLLVGSVAAWADLGAVPLFAVCAPIAILVPGALITNALLELTATDIVTGSSRLMYGLIVLGFMTVGITAGGALTGLGIDPASATLVGDAASLSSQQAHWLGALPPVWAAWLGVPLLAAGVGLAFGSGSQLTLLGIAVMVCTYAVLTVTTPLIGGIAAIGVAGAALFVAARSLERSGFSVPAAITFQPAFLLLVPGTVGLVALATLSEGSLSAAPATFVSLCIGVKVGSVIVDTPWDRVFRRVAARG